MDGKLVYLRFALRRVETVDKAGAEYRARRLSYTPALMETAHVAHLEGDVGYKYIVKEDGGFCLSESGVENVCERLRRAGETDRKMGLVGGK